AIAAGLGPDVGAGRIHFLVFRLGLGDGAEQQQAAQHDFCEFGQFHVFSSLFEVAPDAFQLRTGETSLNRPSPGGKGYGLTRSSWLWVVYVKLFPKVFLRVLRLSSCGL